jgi:arginyl-tRNA synthetase
MKNYLREHLESALRSMGVDLKEAPVLEKPKQEIHGDLTTNLALVAAKSIGRKPREFAVQLVAKLSLDPAIVSKVEIAGPGFINFTFAPGVYTRHLAAILKAGKAYGRSTRGNGIKTQVEFVSANPTGPLTVGHGRQAAIGDTIANLLEWNGYPVVREYYYNNAGGQMKKLAESTYARYRQASEPTYPFPENGYQGDYIRDIAAALRATKGDTLLSLDLEEALSHCQRFAEEQLFEAIKKVLARMGVVFDVFYNEDTLYKEGKISEVIAEFRAKGLAYDRDGAVWLKGAPLGLEHDRVIVKSTGEPTYRLPDIAYHREKFRRGFDFIVDIFGADHIEESREVLAGIKALGFDPGKVAVVIHQFVTLVKDGQEVKMSKRAANFVSLDELIDDVGPDVVRFFFVMRSNSSHLEFDVNLAEEHSEKNPVFYLQYAHARIASIMRFADSEGNRARALEPSWVEAHAGLLKEPSEIALAKILTDFPDVVDATATNFEIHRLPVYLSEVAASYHKFYHEHRVMNPDPDLSAIRLALCEATRVIIANGLAILGISAPDRM